MDRDQQSDFSEQSVAWEILTRQELGVNIMGEAIDGAKSDEIENGKFTSTVNKQDFIEAILEWERQEEIQASLLLAYAAQLEALSQKVNALLHSERSAMAKQLLYQLFLSDAEWIDLLSDERIQAWQSEAIALM